MACIEMMHNILQGDKEKSSPRPEVSIRSPRRDKWQTEAHKLLTLLNFPLIPSHSPLMPDSFQAVGCSARGAYTQQFGALRICFTLHFFGSSAAYAVVYVSHFFSPCQPRWVCTNPPACELWWPKHWQSQSDFQERSCANSSGAVMC